MTVAVFGEMVSVPGDVPLSLLHAAPDKTARAQRYAPQAPNPREKRWPAPLLECVDPLDRASTARWCKIPPTLKPDRTANLTKIRRTVKSLATLDVRAAPGSRHVVRAWTPLPKKVTLCSPSGT
jgi:hypothetical protein